MAQLDKIRLSGTTYDIVDATAVHSLDGYYTTGETNTAITAATNALAESIAEQGYQTSGDVQNAISGKADTTAVTQEVSAAVSGYADSVIYNSTSKYVEFYHGGTGGTKVFEYDAAPFLIDGMVQNVEIKNVAVTQTFQTGYEDFTPKSPFQESNYETSATNAVGDYSSFNLSRGQLLFYLKVMDSSNTETIIDNAGSFPTNDYVTFSVQDDVVTIVPASGYRLSCIDMRNITENGGMPISALCDWTVTAATTCLVITFNTDAGKQDINIPISDIFDASNYYTKAEVDAELSGKVDSSTYTAYTAATDSALSGKQETLVSGTNIKTINNESILGSGNLTIDTGNKVEVSGTTLVFL